MPTHREIALFIESFPETTESPHFEKTSFRVRKKIFATMDLESKRLTLKLSLIDQDVFSSIGNASIYPVDNSWGKQGWTIFELESLETEIIQDALKQAYRSCAPKSLLTNFD